ncbi:unnamed protein product [Cyclocybe aegerita]|uniref:MULE transposase domain-containing protein n=1 Tax=Cyclocybe aegerita TaxID=1973307 RepID=A0A8S0X8F9_CYCAE|nr:unnamed protein product [Cyclocybe aegerita]
MSLVQDPPIKQLCTKCHSFQPLDNFKKSRDGFNKTCITCGAKHSERYRKQKKRIADEDKENEGGGNSEGGDLEQGEEESDEVLCRELGHVSLEEFLDQILEALSLHSFAAVINIDEGISGTHREKADKILEKIWDAMDYRFVYNHQYVHKQTPSSRISYHYAQNSCCQNDPKKERGENVKERDKGSMPTFACDGWFHVTIYDDKDIALIKYKHMGDHIPYCNIDLPASVLKLINKNPELNATQLWNIILKDFPRPNFTQKQVYHAWRKGDNAKYRFNNNHLKSAELLLEDAKKMKGLYRIEPISLPKCDSFQVIAFSLPELLTQWGGKIKETVLDSAFGYLLIQRDKDVEEGVQQEYIEELLNHFKKKWKIRPLFTITDKNIAEIKAFLRKFPDAKHQLCFWHCLRAIKTRLLTLHHCPKFYDVKEARKEFLFIDKSFVPLAQAEKILPNPAQQIASKQIPRVSIRMGSVLMNTAPIPAPPATAPSAPVPEASSGTRQVLFRFDGADIQSVDIPSNIFDQVDAINDCSRIVKMLMITNSRKERQRLLTELMCSARPSIASSSYTCLPNTSVNILHFLSVLKGHGTPLRSEIMPSLLCTPSAISMVSPRFGDISGHYILRLRTTMSVENFWKQLKHNFIPTTTHPRLDHLVWILIYRVTPAYIARMDTLNDNY